MKKGSLFFAGLLSAVITIISLNLAFGNRWSGYSNHWGHHHHECYGKYDGRSNNNSRQNLQDADTTHSNY